MLGAYEGLMKAAPQGIGQPAQSMGGQAMPAGWKEAEAMALSKMPKIKQRMDQIKAMYPDPEMDVLPEHAHEYSDLQSKYSQMRALWEHSQAKNIQQQELNRKIHSDSDVSDVLTAIAAGQSPPPMPKR